MKSPYMAAGFVLITETADITFGDFVHALLVTLCVNCGVPPQGGTHPSSFCKFYTTVRLI
jgi:hypothetical protein